LACFGLRKSVIFLERSTRLSLCTMLSRLFIADRGALTALLPFISLQDTWKLYRLCKGGPYQDVLRSFFDHGGLFYPKIIEVLQSKLPSPADDSDWLGTLEQLCNWFTLLPGVAKLYGGLDEVIKDAVPSWLRPAPLEFTVDKAYGFNQSQWRDAPGFESAADYVEKYVYNMETHKKLLVWANDNNPNHKYIRSVCMALLQALGRRKSVFALGLVEPDESICRRIGKYVVEILKAGFHYHEASLTWAPKDPLKPWFYQLKVDVIELYGDRDDIPPSYETKMVTYERLGPISYILEGKELRTFKHMSEILEDWADGVHERVLFKRVRQAEAEKKKRAKEEKRKVKAEKRKRERQAKAAAKKRKKRKHTVHYDDDFYPGMSLDPKKVWESRRRMKSEEYTSSSSSASSSSSSSSASSFSFSVSSPYV